MKRIYINKEITLEINKCIMEEIHHSISEWNKWEDIQNIYTSLKCDPQEEMNIVDRLCDHPNPIISKFANDTYMDFASRDSIWWFVQDVLGDHWRWMEKYIGREE